MDEDPLISPSLTVVIVDDHESFRRSAAALLGSGGLRVVAVAADGHAALDVIAELQPAVVVLDVRLPDLTGFEVARRLALLPRPPAVVLVSSLGSDEVLPRVDLTTVRGFVPKTELTPQRVRELAGA